MMISNRMSFGERLLNQGMPFKPLIQHMTNRVRDTVGNCTEIEDNLVRFAEVSILRVVREYSRLLRGLGTKQNFLLYQTLENRGLVRKILSPRHNCSLKHCLSSDSPMCLPIFSSFEGLLLMLVSGLHIGWGIWRTGEWPIQATNTSLFHFTIMAWPFGAIFGSFIGSALVTVLRKSIIYVSS